MVLSSMEAVQIKKVFNQNSLQGIPTTAINHAQSLEESARRALNLYKEKSEEAFIPECLTVYLSNDCNFQCQYCYSHQSTSLNCNENPAPENQSIMNPAIVFSAAELVAGYCKETRKKFHLVFHGGGEPTFHLDRLKTIRSQMGALCKRFNIELFSYIATNGYLDESTVYWLIKNISLIGLPCDGPPELQDTLRPSKSGKKSSYFIERTARILREKDHPFIVRSTITPFTIEKQEDIVLYLQEILGAREIRFEPVYLSDESNKLGFKPHQAAIFVESFLKAQKLAQHLGCQLSLSGARVDELHGPHCNVTKQVLQVSPSGVASACFLFSPEKSNNSGTSPWEIGELTEDGTTFQLDRDRISEFRKKAFEIPENCKDCVNMLHCARNCPDTCYIHPETPFHNAREISSSPKNNNFRCQVQRLLTEHWIMENAGLRDKCQSNFIKEDILNED
jgi:radical SAM protein with 4Fe4S-binding SPASM domain